MNLLRGFFQKKKTDMQHFSTSEVWTNAKKKPKRSKKVSQLLEHLLTGQKQDPKEFWPSSRTFWVIFGTLLKPLVMSYRRFTIKQTFTSKVCVSKKRCLQTHFAKKKHILRDDLPELGQLGTTNKDKYLLQTTGYQKNTPLWSLMVTVHEKNRLPGSNRLPKKIPLQGS